MISNKQSLLTSLHSALKSVGGSVVTRTRLLPWGFRKCRRRRWVLGLPGERRNEFGGTISVLRGKILNVHWHIGRQYISEDCDLLSRFGFAFVSRQAPRRLTLFCCRSSSAVVADPIVYLLPVAS